MIRWSVLAVFVVSTLLSQGCATIIGLPLLPKVFEPTDPVCTWETGPVVIDGLTAASLGILSTVSIFSANTDQNLEYGAIGVGASAVLGLAEVIACHIGLAREKHKAEAAAAPVLPAPPAPAGVPTLPATPPPPAQAPHSDAGSTGPRAPWVHNGLFPQLDRRYLLIPYLNARPATVLYSQL